MNYKVEADPAVRIRLAVATCRRRQGYGEPGIR